MATTPLRGAGRSGKSKRENSPGESGMAKIMECDFHCSLSSISNSLDEAKNDEYRDLGALLHELQAFCCSGSE